MSFPGNMKTGLSVGVPHENMFPETFFIIYLVLGAILRRCGFKDCLVYSEHNSLMFNQDIFDSGVLFNLFSEHGVGKSLEPLIHELFSTVTLNPQKNRDNIFFKEIVRLSDSVSKIVRSHNSDLETGWIMNYAMTTDKLVDPIAIERETRLAVLFGHSYESDESDLSENNDPHYDYDDYSDEGCDIPSYDRVNIINIKTKCTCDFCEEFQKYHHPDQDRNVTEILNEVLMRIAQKINNDNITTDVSIKSNDL